jgi:small GTP-binding protein
MQKEEIKTNNQKGKANKVVIIGDSNVGKTCLITRYVEDKFGETQPTIGALHRMKHVNGIDLDIWDTAGQERFKSMIPMYYKGAKAIMVAFDVTDLKSFQNAEKWLNEIDSTTQGCLIILVGNKIDLAESRVVSTEQIKTFCDNKKIIFFECSAKDGTNIIELFFYIAQKVKEQVPVEKNINIGEGLLSTNRICCFN